MTRRGPGYAPTARVEDLEPPSRDPSPSAGTQLHGCTEGDGDVLAENLAAVLTGLTHAARRQTVVADQAVAVARDAVWMLEARARSSASTPSAAVVALRGRLTEIDGRTATVRELDEVTAALATLRDSRLAALDPEPPGTATADQLYIALARARFTYRDEDQLQAGLTAALADAGYEVQREVRLGGRDRVDLLVAGVCVEVKLGGSVDRLAAQLARYARHDEVRELLVVTARARHRALPPTIGGKPCRVLHLGGVR